MKKFLISLFAIFYLGVASGATVHFHYCMGELLSWGLTKSKARQCGNCGMEKSDAKKCCKDEQRQLKVEKAQKSQNNFQFAKLVFPVSTPRSAEPIASTLPAAHAALPFSHAPPPAAKAPVFLQNRNFRI